MSSTSFYRLYQINDQWYIGYSIKRPYFYYCSLRFLFTVLILYMYVTFSLLCFHPCFCLLRLFVAEVALCQLHETNEEIRKINLSMNVERMEGAPIRYLLDANYMLATTRVPVPHPHSAGVSGL